MNAVKEGIVVSWKLKHCTHLNLQCHDDTHSVVLGEKGVRLSESDYLLAKQFILSIDGSADKKQLEIVSRSSGFHSECIDLDNHLSHLGFILTYGLGTKISLRRTSAEKDAAYDENRPRIVYSLSNARIG